MDPTQQPIQQPPLQPQSSAVTYYNTDRKRSFLFSRIMIITSMTILVVTLGINIFSLVSPNTATLKSNAFSTENPTKNLPILPHGCLYQQTQKSLIVICPTPTPMNTTPINIELPKLPPQCSMQTSASGSAIQCTSPHDPIPTIAVALPINCIATPQVNIFACKNSEGKIIAVPLPSLPAVCSYTQQENKDYVTCEPK